ncbi:unnamed protein product [Oppiella nova]|uniref:Uncharacterized protein n=1 Tax=Oppiella nova TaxID=334625 RepID=A0A7R9QLW2_9ACAR|nr:unnamed protein product [Oppiella nova]CAG2167593.1 unnamed protein product [Oppiella nova]
MYITIIAMLCIVGFANCQELPAALTLPQIVAEQIHTDGYFTLFDRLEGRLHPLLRLPIGGKSQVIDGKNLQQLSVDQSRTDDNLPLVTGSEPQDDGSLVLLAKGERLAVIPAGNTPDSRCFGGYGGGFGGFNRGFGFGKRDAEGQVEHVTDNEPDVRCYGGYPGGFGGFGGFNRGYSQKLCERLAVIPVGNTPDTRCFGGYGGGFGGFNRGFGFGKRDAEGQVEHVTDNEPDVRCYGGYPGGFGGFGGFNRGFGFGK